MPKKKKDKDRNWMVPMRIKGKSTVYVRAPNAEEALQKAHSGDWKEEDIGESEWVPSGPAELNE